jgi:hypothetical protein
MDGKLAVMQSDAAGDVVGVVDDVGGLVFWFPVEPAGLVEASSEAVVRGRLVTAPGSVEDDDPLAGEGWHRGL